MRTIIAALLLLILLSPPAAAEDHGFQDELLDRFTGTWVMTGSIAGDEVVHDLVAEWVLGHHYLRFHEVARGKDDDGRPLYEAIVILGWDEPSERYACLWLDSTGGGGLTNGVIGYATRKGDTIPFVFDTGDGTAIHNTFAYDREADTWRWAIDNVRDGTPGQFARVVLRRK